MVADGWDFLIAKADLGRTELRRRPAQPLSPGDVRLAVESFSLTANNITYGAMGDAFGYWKFFPAPEGLGRIPVWGYATVSESANPEVAVGQRLFGYLPMSTDFVAQLERRADGFVDAAAHRAELPPTYNAYQTVAADDELGDYRSLLRPLFMTSWLLDDFLAELGAPRSVILSSASSKTALGLAWLLARRGVKVVGLTSPGNVAFLQGLGFFDQVATYDAIPGLAVETPAVLVDFAGNPAVMAAVHQRLGNGLMHSAIVGATHWDAERNAAAEPLPGPTPTLFFAPDQIRKRAKEWGMTRLNDGFAEALRSFVAANSWLTIVRSKGPEGLAAAYAEVLAGRADPKTGHIITPA
jgi:hypothetical protein